MTIQKVNTRLIRSKRRNRARVTHSIARNIQAVKEAQRQYAAGNTRFVHLARSR